MIFRSIERLSGVDARQLHAGIRLGECIPIPHGEGLCLDRYGVTAAPHNLHFSAIISDKLPVENRSISDRADSFK